MWAVAISLFVLILVLLLKGDVRAGVKLPLCWFFFEAKERKLKSDLPSARR